MGLLSLLGTLSRGVNRVPRVYLPPAVFADDKVHPSSEVAHYLHRVLRLRPGDRWAALDGRGRSWLCEVVDKGQSRRLADWSAVEPLTPEILVGLALCKGSRFEDALEKLAELGVVRTVPLQTERTERGLPSPAKQIRWQEIARSASALANRAVPMEIAPPSSLDDFLCRAADSNVFFAHLGAPSARDVLSPSLRQLSLLIGPEGGFSTSETERLKARACGVSLGPLTLRVETAAVCAVSLALALCARPETGKPG